MVLSHGLFPGVPNSHCSTKLAAITVNLNFLACKATPIKDFKDKHHRINPKRRPQQNKSSTHRLSKMRSSGTLLVLSKKWPCVLILLTVTY